MLTTILLSLAVIVILFVVIVALQPSEFRVARSTTISAPPAAVFAEVNDFHKWEAWNSEGCRATITTKTITITAREIRIFLSMADSRR